MFYAEQGDLLCSMACIERFNIEFFKLVGLEIDFDELGKFVKADSQVLQAIARHLDSGRIIPNVCIELADSILVSKACLEEIAGSFVLPVLLKDIDAQEEGTCGHLRGLKLHKFTVNQGGSQYLERHLGDDIMLIIIQDAKEALQGRDGRLEVHVEAEML